MSNPLDMTGRTVMVTGATGALGSATASVIADLGGRVVLVGRRLASLQTLRESLQGTGHAVSEFDLNELDSITRWMKQVAADEGPLAGLVHSAGMHQLSPLAVASPAKVEKLMRINFAAAIELTRGFRQRAVRDDSGSVVYLSSIMGLVGQRGVSAYSASKGALVALARSLALELADECVRVNCVCPGVVQSPLASQSEEPMTDDQAQAIHDLHPLGLGRPEDVANAAVFLLSQASRWMTGQSLVVDGGYTAR